MKKTKMDSLSIDSIAKKNQNHTKSIMSHIIDSEEKTYKQGKSKICRLKQHELGKS